MINNGNQTSPEQMQMDNTSIHNEGGSVAQGVGSTRITHSSRIRNPKTTTTNERI